MHEQLESPPEALQGRQHIAGTAAASPTYTYIYGSYVDESVLRTDSAGGKLYYHRNQQYSIVALTDGVGAITERYAYTAYGEPTVMDGAGTVLPGSDNRYTYTGREWDSELGLYHYRARMYDPVAGRFVSRDPIGFEGSPWNLFEYVESQPMQAVDPTGRNWFFPPITPHEIVEEANRRRGKGPWDDSAQHCWAACYVSAVYGAAAGNVIAILADIAEGIAPSGDAARDIVAQHVGANVPTGFCPTAAFLAPYQCDNHCMSH